MDITEPKPLLLVTEFGKTMYVFLGFDEKLYLRIAGRMCCLSSESAQELLVWLARAYLQEGGHNE